MCVRPAEENGLPPLVVFTGKAGSYKTVTTTQNILAGGGGGGGGEGSKLTVPKSIKCFGDWGGRKEPLFDVRYLYSCLFSGKNS